MSAFGLAFSGQAVQWSPFIPNRLAVATAQNFGIVGNGRLYVLEQPTGVAGAPHVAGPLAEVVHYDTLDGVYDCCWAESAEHVLAAACGDGYVRVYDVARPAGANPVRAYRGHAHEVASLSWNQVRHDSFLSASWDDTVKLWTLDRPAPLAEYRGHTYCVYQVAWNPQSADVFLTASGDHTTRVWDVRHAQGARLSLNAQGGEVLSADWCKYDDCVVATGSVDRHVRVWDLRRVSAPLAVLPGHQFAVRRVQFSPHQATVLATCSYDMSVRLWDYARAQGGGPPQLRTITQHTEFAIDVDFSLLQAGMVATTGWDHTVHLVRL